LWLTLADAGEAESYEVDKVDTPPPPYRLRGQEVRSIEGVGPSQDLTRARAYDCDLCDLSHARTPARAAQQT